MAQLIDKDALVAEIERRIDELYDFLPDASKVENGSITMSEACNTGKYTALESIRRFIDTLEVKEVDLEKEIREEYLKHRCYGGRDNMLVILNEPQFNKTAKRFFELGLNASNPLTWEDIKTIYLLVQVEWIPKKTDEEIYKEVLKRFKAKKGEDA